VPGTKPAVGGNARAALVAVVTATGATARGREICASLLDQATRVLLEAPPGLLTAVGGKADPIDRHEGVELLTAVCAQCRMCPRGQTLPDPPDPGLGPIGGQKWRRR
jgi:hypothetical protein